MRHFDRLQDIARDTSGNIMLLSAFSLTALVGAAGLATDTVQWTLWKRQLQREADSAATAGAMTNYQGGSAYIAAATEIGRMNLVTLTSPAAVEVGPTSGPYTGNHNAVRVVLQTSVRLPFSSFFLHTPPVVRAEATAAAVTIGTYCVISFDNTVSTGITFQGSSTTNLGCGVATNAQGSTAVYAGGSSTVTASPVAAVGGVPTSNNYATGTVYQPYSMAQTDPLSSLPTPSLPNCSGQLSVSPNQTRNINNSGGVSCYRGMDLKGTVNFAPGIYYIDGGSINVGSQATITGSGVTFIFTSSTADTNPASIATLNINGGATLNLTAPGSGTYASVLFYQDRRALHSSNGNSTTNFVTGNSSSILQGSVYFPQQSVQFTGNTGMNTNCVNIYAWDVTFTGNSAISNVCPSNSGMQPVSGVQVRLVS
mgnify:CR=1 FL=1